MKVIVSLALVFCLAVPVSAWSACTKVKRSAAVLRHFQQMHPCPSTGLTSGACPGYVKDHIVPLCLLGKKGDTVNNLQWQSLEESHVKDRIERQQCRVVGCAHRGD
jgi:hypothetical protein